jgi:hypothetical protein
LRALWSDEQAATPKRLAIHISRINKKRDSCIEGGKGYYVLNLRVTDGTPPDPPLLTALRVLLVLLFALYVLTKGVDLVGESKCSLAMSDMKLEVVPEPSGKEL